MAAHPMDVEDNVIRNLLQTNRRLAKVQIATVPFRCSVSSPA
jgi:hypothetical protein